MGAHGAPSLHMDDFAKRKGGKMQSDGTWR